MKNDLQRKLKSSSGINRAVALLLVLAAVLLVIIMIPTIKRYIERSEKIGCETALDTAYRQYVVGYLMKGGQLTGSEAKEVITFAMNGWDDICPGGGNIYILKNGRNTEEPYRLVCGKHGEDKKECARLNAGYLLDTIRDEVKKSRKNGVDYPETINLKLNGKKLTAKLTDEPTGLKRGTYSSSGYDGTVVFYSISGHGKLGDELGAEKGEVCYFCFANDDYCASWKYLDGWSGNAFE